MRARATSPIKKTLKESFFAEEVNTPKDVNTKKSGDMELWN